MTDLNSKTRPISLTIMQLITKQYQIIKIALVFSLYLFINLCILKIYVSYQIKHFPQINQESIGHHCCEIIYLN